MWTEAQAQPPDRSETAPAFVTGNVTTAPLADSGALGKQLGATGRPTPASAATASLVWLPGLAHAEVGDAITPVVVATTQTDAKGAYTLTASPTADMVNEANENGGWLNLDLVISDRNGSRSTEKLARLWDGKQWRAGYEKQPAALSPQTTMLDASEAPANAMTPQSINPTPQAVAYGCQYVVTATDRRPVRWSGKGNQM
jgi:hypothetical protein